MQTQAFRLTNIGGTFSVLHQGHKDYIDYVFSLAKQARVGIKSTAYAQITKRYPVPPLNYRLARLKEYLAEKHYIARVQTFVIYEKPEDFPNELLNPLLDCVVATDEYIETVHLLNSQREAKGFARYSVHLMPLTLQNGNKLSATSLILKK